MAIPTESSQARPHATRSRWAKVSCPQCNKTTVLRLRRRDSTESLREELTCLRCKMSPEVESCDPPASPPPSMPVLVAAGIALALAFGYTAKLFADAVDYQVAQNTRLSPNGGYYDRMERRGLPDALR